jgi:hypothetical protein
MLRGRFFYPQIPQILRAVKYFIEAEILLEIKRPVKHPIA